MSIFYMLHTNTPLTVIQVEQAIGKAAISQDILSIDVAIPHPAELILLNATFTSVQPLVSLTTSCVEITTRVAAP